MGEFKDFKAAVQVQLTKMASEEMFLVGVDKDELWELKDRLEAADVWVSQVMDNGFIHSIFSTDPNNIQLEFCYRINGMSLSDIPKMMDTSPSSVTLEGSEPQSDKWPSIDKPTPPEKRKIYPGVLKKLVEKDE